MQQTFENCYVKLIMKVRVTEAFDSTGKLIFTRTPTKEAILHERQANDATKLNKIQKQMWQDLCEEKGWKTLDASAITKLCSFIMNSIPKKSAPITYKF